MEENKKPVWNKGLTKETDERVRKGAKTLKTRFANGTVKPSFTGKTHSEETKQKISESMKRAHSEGRAYVWEHRTTKPTAPEKFLIGVLKNELNMECGKDYTREFPYKGFFLDFCWVDKKLVIEMDGSQHERYPEQIERDIRKDKMLQEDGYLELRIPWKDCCNNKKEYVKKIKDFLTFKN